MSNLDNLTSKIITDAKSKADEIIKDAEEKAKQKYHHNPFAERGIQRKRPSQGAHRYIPTAFGLYNSQRTGERRGFL